ncbi:MAG TPA: rod shape-determining protein [Pseudonocardia sp.]|jgi:rod shape-determining protein MreB|uniref:rod shape-determining protein n=1 Tax=Pseudonocardia sp. TaxID=60912 RepID=UPI002B9F41F8|nr:rod shape-determining protein [Pseudonocardia sp.]HTF50629.1 rod shape-determining protein [Pseudonocardia sp.]
MQEFGIDLGTANTVVCDSTEGVVLDEPSVMLTRAGFPRRGVVAVGREACELLGRSPAGVYPVRPLQDGVITDLESARLYLRSVLHRIAPNPWGRARMRAAIGVPVGATTLERRALLEAADEAGIHRACALPEPIAGAIGCGIDPLERRAHLVVDVGGGTAEATSFCYGGILAHRSCRVAGDEMTLAVTHHLREQHQILIGELTAEQVKIQASTADGPSLVVQGRDAGTGRPRLATLEVNELNEVVRPVIDGIIQTLAACLDELPPQATCDILADGVALFGGGSLICRFGDSLERAFGFPVKLAERPLTCVAEGATLSLHNPDLLHSYASPSG